MWSKLKQHLVPVYFATWFGYFAFFWSRLFLWDSTGNLIAGHVNVWGDWAAHFTMGSAMAYRQLFLSQSPFLLGERFSYPFLTNFISAVLIRAGVPFLSAFVVPSFIFSCAVVVALYYFFLTLCKSRKVAVIASLLFLLNGGVGAAYFLSDIVQSPQPWQTVVSPPQEYTRIDEAGIKWLSVIDSMIIPQRAFSVGFPLALLVLSWLYRYFFRSSGKKWQLILSSLILGVLPLIHTHSFLAVSIILVFWFLSDLVRHPKEWFRRILSWIVLGTLAGALAVPLYFFFFMDQVRTFIQWYPGWLSQEYNENWFIFWFKNWGVMPLLGAFGFVSYIANSSQKIKEGLIFVPFLLLFGVSNLFLFQPFAWDNTKVLVWAAVGISALTAWLFVHKFTTLINKSAVIFLFLFSISAGSIDAYRILRRDLHEYQMYSSEEIELASWVKKNTSSDSIWLTGSNHNHWLFNLTGRQAVMTYPGWLWTHGYDYASIELRVDALYQRPRENQDFRNLGIEYIVVGPHERQELQADEAAFSTSFEVIKQTPQYRIFKSP